MLNASCGRRVRWGASVLVLGLCGAAPPALAVDFSYSGFLNVTAGRVFSGGGLDINYPNTANYKNCPCYTVDYSHGSVYGTQWTAGPESRGGLQGTASFTPDFSFTAQLVARTAVQTTGLGVEWAYFGYNITPKFTVQVGRKRLPLFFYSDFQDVSFAYSWVRVPPDVYGWAVVNYNGANLTYRDEVAGWAVKSNVYLGSEHSHDAPIAHLSDTDRVDVNWTNMRGIDLELTRDWFSVRFAINKSKQQLRRLDALQGFVQTSPNLALFGERSPQTFSSLAVGIDRGDLIVRTEVSRVDRSPARGSYKGFIVGAGYRLGKFVPMVTYSGLLNYNDAYSTITEQDRQMSYTLRYQLDDSSSIKGQIDLLKWRYIDGTDTDTRRKLLSVSYERLF